MPITNEGFEARRFSEIVEDINTDQKTTIASDLDTTPETLLGTLTSIFAAAVSDQEELLQAVADNLNIDKADGTFLDDLTALVGISRLQAAPTTGRLEAKGNLLTVIHTGNQFSDGTNTFQSTASLTLSENQCTNVVYSIPSVTQGLDYNLVINSLTYSYTAQAGDTVDEVFEFLEEVINSDTSNTFATASYNSVDSLLTVTTDQLLVNLSMSSSSTISVSEVTGVVFIENIVEGPVVVAANAVTSIVDAITGLTSVSNPVALNTGRNLETDEELRARQSTAVRKAGTATVPAIQATLLEVEGVTDVDVIENTSLETDTNGRPGKSYEVVITGGVSTDIAQTIFDTKPAGIQTYGDFLNIVTFEGEDYTVFFSRPVDVYIWAEIEYTLYDEEMFPSEGEQGIADAFVEFGSGLDNGIDVIPKRSYKNIYNGVEGIDDLTVKVASTSSPAITPDPTDYAEVTIPILAKQLAVFDTSRVTVSLST